MEEKIILLGELYEEGKDLLIKIAPPEQFGEDYDCERLQNVLKEMRDIAAEALQNAKPATG